MPPHSFAGPLFGYRAAAIPSAHPNLAIIVYLIDRLYATSQQIFAIEAEC
jgi:hypothetical protein